MKSKYGLSRHSASENRLSGRSGAATGAAGAPRKRCSVEAQRLMNCIVSAVCASNAPVGRPCSTGRVARSIGSFRRIVGELHLDLARLARPQICGQHLAALLYGLTNVAGERFRVGNWKLGSEAVSLACGGGAGGRPAARLVRRVWNRSRKAARPSVGWQSPASELLAARLFSARRAPHLRPSARRLCALGRQAWLSAPASCDAWAGPPWAVLSFFGLCSLIVASRLRSLRATLAIKKRLLSPPG